MKSWKAWVTGGRKKQAPFNDEVRQLIVFAREDAVARGYDYIGTETLLLGLLRQRDSEACRVLVDLGVDADTVRARLLESVPPGNATPGAAEIPYTSRSKVALERAVKAAEELQDAHVGSEHVLLGLVHGEKSIAALVLKPFGVSYDDLTKVILRRRG